METEKQKILAASPVKPDPAMVQILNKLDSMSEVLERQEGAEEFPGVENVRSLLRKNDFSQNYIDRIMGRLRRELPIEVLADEKETQQRVLEWIGEDVQVAPAMEQAAAAKKPRIISVVGPTGVGKTTTIAKLASSMLLESRHAGMELKVCLFSVDRFKIGAKEQLKEYTDILGTPFEIPTTADEMRKDLTLYGPAMDVIFVDTIGKSPKESKAIAEMKEILDVCRERIRVNDNAEITPSYEAYFAIAANMKTNDVEEFMRQFEPFDYKSLIITKTDETSTLGNIISLAWEKKKSISWLTDGQKVPKDIKEAGVLSVLMSLTGFEPDVRRLREKFGDA
jgi:flagellar biosynthesis protein FlhF